MVVLPLEKNKHQTTNKLDLKTDLKTTNQTNKRVVSSTNLDLNWNGSLEKTVPVIHAAEHYGFRTSTTKLWIFTFVLQFQSKTLVKLSTWTMASAAIFYVLAAVVLLHSAYSAYEFSYLVKHISTSLANSQHLPLDVSIKQGRQKLSKSANCGTPNCLIDQNWSSYWNFIGDDWHFGI